MPATELQKSTLRDRIALEYGARERQWFKLIVRDNPNGSQTTISRIPIERNPLTGILYPPIERASETPSE
jgi:hypothetical protein